MREGNGFGFATVAFDLPTVDVKHPSFRARVKGLGFRVQHMLVPPKVKELYDTRQNL